MKRKSSFKLGIGLASSALLVLSAVAFGPCTEKRPFPNGLAGFKVTVTPTGAAGGTGSATDPFDYPDGDIQISFEAEAIDQHGQPLAWEGDTTLKIMPGEMVGSPTIRFSGGRAAGAVTARKTFGRMTLWVEDVHLVTGDLAPGAVPYQLTWPEGSYATGVSNIVSFKNPTFRNIQFDQWIYKDEKGEAGAGKNDVSSLPGNFVEIECHTGASGPLSNPDGKPHGQLLVTGIFAEGFFVTDLADPAAEDAPKGFNHLYVYNYSYPDDLEVGDRLDSLMGTTQDFSGATQISFPAWVRAVNEAKDPLPFRVPEDELDKLLPPKLITQVECDEPGGGTNLHLCGYSKQAWTLEAWESARVRLTDLKFPDVLVNCDFNGNTEITPEQPTRDGETDCRNACLKRGDPKDPNKANRPADIVAKEIIATGADLLALAKNRCSGNGECPGGKCGEDGICREICPWEMTIEGIEPACLRIVVPNTYVCSELSTLRQFGQWTAAMGGGQGPLINLLTRDTRPEFDPTSSANLGKILQPGEFIQGNLRQVRAARPRWIVLVGQTANDAPAWMGQ